MDRSRRKRFLRNLFDAVANGIFITIEHHRVGDQTRDSNVSALRSNYFQCVFQVPKDQESIYRPVLDDYVAKNRTPFVWIAISI